MISPYKWNVIKKTSKQAKYNQRHGNKVQLPEERGERDNKGRTVKEHVDGHMEKAKGFRFEGGSVDGWGRGHGVGVNEDKCT